MIDAPIMPAFVRWPNEGATIGRLLAGYGEIEFMLGLCLGEAVTDRSAAFRILFRSRGEEQRIKIADALLRPAYTKIGLVDRWDIARRAMNWCRITRNLYSHCHWLDDDTGLFFTRVEDAVKTDSTEQLSHIFYPIDVTLLDQQEAYFRHTSNALHYLYYEHQVLSGKLKHHISLAPEDTPPPLRQNLPKTPQGQARRAD